MAKKKAAPKAKANKPRIGQQTKTTSKGAHGGGVKFGQVALGPGFKNVAKQGINTGKAASTPKKGISEGRNVAKSRPAVVMGKGFIAPPSITTESTCPAVKPKKGPKKGGRKR
jgi:hypothetical protein